MQLSHLTDTHPWASGLLRVLRPVKARNVVWTHSKNFTVSFSGGGGASPMVACNTTNVLFSEASQRFGILNP